MWAALTTKYEELESVAKLGGADHESRQRHSGKS
ncbi:hypothetical protein FRIGORI9N_400137 [Frigoribacterium sp. 9N]|nr:hypothetical protein FRIGORI9N_400137 [Frigoribacterium sp. 9N]